MPRKKYRALDLQQLTSPRRSRSLSDRACDHLDRSDSLLSENRNSALVNTSSTNSESLKLPNTCILGPSSRQALELLRFGSASKAIETPAANSSPSLVKPLEPRIFLESEFPPLSQSLSHPPDSGHPRRCVTSPELGHQPHPLLSPSVSSWTFDTCSEGTVPLDLISNPDCGLDLHLAPNSAQTSIESTELLPVHRRDTLPRSELCAVSADSAKRSFRNDMASAFPQMSGDARRHYPSGSNRYENRPPVNRQTSCKNGPLCRKFQEGRLMCSCIGPCGTRSSSVAGTCPFNHDFSSTLPPANGLGVFVARPTYSPFKAKTRLLARRNPSMSSRRLSRRRHLQRSPLHRKVRTWASRPRLLLLPHSPLGAQVRRSPVVKNVG